MEQLYVDSFASILERLQYKKSQDAASYRTSTEGHVLHCGHDPFLVGIYSKKISLKGNTLDFSYRIVDRKSVNPLDFTFEERSQSLQIDA